MVHHTISIPRFLKEFAHIFNGAGFSVYLVGGAVRDSLMGRTPTDFDVTTNARPEQMQQLFSRTIPTGIEHGTITILYKGMQIEATTFRADQGYSDGRHPDTIAFADTLEEDLSRRDFTMNAIAADMETGTIIDPYNGYDDIQHKIIRTVGTATERFTEDGLRPLRGIRFAAQLAFTIETETLRAITPALPITKKVATERFREEFCKILTSSNPLIGLKLMEENGITGFFLPELIDCRNVEQRGLHSFDVLDHLYYSCSGCPKNTVTVRTAALLHDIGKPQVRAQKEDGVYTFYQHEMVSASLAKKILQRLKFSNQQIDDICALIEMHMFHYEPIWTDAAVRRFLAKATTFTRTSIENGTGRTLSDFLDDLFALRQGDTFGITGHLGTVDNLAEFSARIDSVLAESSAISLKSLALSGKDLIAAGIPAGKHMGLILDELLNTVIDSPAMNEKEKLLIIAQKFFERIHQDKNT